MGLGSSDTDAIKARTLNLTLGKAAVRLAAEAVKTVAAQGYVLAAAPAGLTAKRTIGTDVDGFVVGALRFRPAVPDQVEYLIVKAGMAQEWVPSRHVELSAV